MDLREVGCDSGDWIDLAEDRDRWRAYVRAVMNLRVPKSQLVIQDVTGPHRQNDRDDTSCREDHFCEGTYIRKHVVYELCAGEGVRP